MANERITDIGPPNYKQFLPPVITENYGKWDYHEILKPGVMVHVAESGDKIFTVRCGSPRLDRRHHHPQVRGYRRQVLRRPSAVHQPQQRRIPAQ